MYFPVHDSVGVRLDWLNDVTDDFIACRIQRRKRRKRKQCAAVLEFEAGENVSDYVSSVAGSTDEGKIKIIKLIQLF